MGWKPDVFLNITEVWEKNGRVRNDGRADHLWKYMKMLLKTEEITFVEIQVVRQVALTLATLKPFSRYTPGLCFHCNVLGLGPDLSKRVENG